MNFRILEGSIIGREHVRLWKNNQDSVRLGETKLRQQTYYYGVICDGSFSGAYSETGANLLSSFIVNEIPLILKAESDLNKVPQFLFHRCVGYLWSIAGQTIVGDYYKTISFIKEHLLCTVIGFIMDEQNGVIFSAGDGVIIINDEITVIDQDNMPMYLAYQLIDRAYLKLPGGQLPENFVTQAIIMANVKRLAIGSDGLTKEAAEVIWQKPDSLTLNRRLKVFTSRETPLFDDCTVITMERQEEPPSF